MNALLLVIWLLITLLPGVCLMQRQLPSQQAGRVLLVLGYGTLLGLMLVPLIMRMLDVAGLPFTLWGIGGCSGILAVLAWFLPRPASSAIAAPPQLHPAPPGKLANLVFLLCVSLIALRLLTLGLEVSLRPVFSWDSKQHWGKQARVLFEMRQLVPYVPLQDWLQSGDPGVYTNMHPDYPVTIPLLQAWANVPWGEWDDTRMNLPWLLAWVALGLVFSGQMLAAGADRAVTAAATYLVLSMPYLNIQVALAGYADLILAVCFCGALAAFCNWFTGRQPWQAGLAFGLALCLPLIKNEGFYWALSLVPGLVVARLGLRRGILAGLGLLLALGLLLLILPSDMVIAGHSLGNMQLAYRPESWMPLLRSLFVHDNWHLLAYAALAVVFATALFSRDVVVQHAPGLAVVVCAFGLYLALYLLTRHAYGAVQYTSLNRVALQLMPAIAFVVALLYTSASRPGESGANLS